MANCSHHSCFPRCHHAGFRENTSSQHRGIVNAKREEVLPSSLNLSGFNRTNGINGEMLACSKGAGWWMKQSSPRKRVGISLNGNCSHVYWNLFPCQHVFFPPDCQTFPVSGNSRDPCYKPWLMLFQLQLTKNNSSIPLIFLFPMQTDWSNSLNSSSQSQSISDAHCMDF